MELDQDLLNLWLQAKDGLSTEQTRRLIETLQESRDKAEELYQELWDKVTWPTALPMQQQWGLDLQTPVDVDPVREVLTLCLDYPMPQGVFRCS